MRPLGLQPFLHPVQDAGGAAGGGEHLEAVVGQAHDGAVVDHHAVDAAHDAVPQHADPERAHQVGVEHVEERAGIGALDIDLAQRRAVEDADTCSGSGAFAQHRGVHVLPGERVVARALPLADVLEHRAARDVPIMHGGNAFRVEHPPAVAAGQGRERDRCVRRPEGGDAEIGHRDAEQFGRDARGDDAGGLALIVRGADGGVALDVLHRPHAGTDRADQVRHRCITLDVDELRGTVGIRNPPQDQGGTRDPNRIRLSGKRFGRRGETETGQGAGGRRATVAQATGQVERACGRAGDTHFIELGTRNERAEGGVVAKGPAHLTEEVHRRIPATADQQHIARQLFGRAVRAGDDGGADPVFTAGPADDRSRPQFDAAGRARLAQVRGDRVPGIDDRGDRHAGVVQVQCGLIRAVVGGEHDGPLADLDAVAVQEGAGTGREHDAGAVVVGEHHRPLVRAGGDDDVPGPDPPHPLAARARGSRGAEVVRTPLQRKDKAVVVVSECGGALQVQHVGIGGEFGDRVGDPLQCRAAGDGVGTAQQGTAGLALFVDQHDAGAGAGGRQCGCQAGRAGPGDQDVGVHMGRVVARGVGDLGEPALPGDASCDESVVQVDGGREEHGLGEWVLDLDQAAGVLGPRRGEAARPAHLDARGDVMHAVRQQRRGQRIPGVAGVLLVVESEGVHRIPVDAATSFGAQCGVHQIVGLCSSSRYTRSNRYVAVSRMALNQRRQPALWVQRSANSPLGLARKNT